MPNLNVTIQTSVPSTSVTVKPSKTAVSGVSIAPQTTVSLGNLTNVDASGAANGNTLVFDAALGKYIVKTIPSIVGGSF